MEEAATASTSSKNEARRVSTEADRNTDTVTDQEDKGQSENNDLSLQSSTEFGLEGCEFEPDSGSESEDGGAVVAPVSDDLGEILHTAFTSSPPPSAGPPSPSAAPTSPSEHRRRGRAERPAFGTLEDIFADDTDDSDEDEERAAADLLFAMSPPPPQRPQTPPPPPPPRRVHQPRTTRRRSPPDWAARLTSPPHPIPSSRRGFRRRDRENRDSSAPSASHRFSPSRVTNSYSYSNARMDDSHRYYNPWYPYSTLPIMDGPFTPPNESSAPARSNSSSSSSRPEVTLTRPPQRPRLFDPYMYHYASGSGLLSPLDINLDGHDDCPPPPGGAIADLDPILEPINLEDGAHAVANPSLPFHRRRHTPRHPPPSYADAMQSLAERNSYGGLHHHHHHHHYHHHRSNRGLASSSAAAGSASQAAAAAAAAAAADAAESHTRALSPAVGGDSAAQVIRKSEATPSSSSSTSGSSSGTSLRIIVGHHPKKKRPAVSNSSSSSDEPRPKRREQHFVVASEQRPSSPSSSAAPQGSASAPTTDEWPLPDRSRPRVAKSSSSGDASGGAGIFLDSKETRDGNNVQSSRDSNVPQSPTEVPVSPPSPQPGPSGLGRPQTQARSSAADLFSAPDLSLDCLSSDTEDSSPEEDVTVVKISRRRKGGAKSSSSSTRHVVEVDLTQESDGSNDDDNIQVEVIQPAPGASASGSSSGGGGIKLRHFATVPSGLLPPNVQSSNNSSRSSTPSTTPAPSAPPPPPFPEAQSSRSSARPYRFHSSVCLDHACNGECLGSSGGFLQSPTERARQLQEEAPPPQDHLPYSGYRPRRLRHPDLFPPLYSMPSSDLPLVRGQREGPAVNHAPNGCPDAHCRIHQVSRRSGEAAEGASASATASCSSNQPSQPSSRRSSTENTTVDSASTSNAESTSSSRHPPTAHQNAPATAHATPPRDQRLLNAVWRMQYSPAMRSGYLPSRQSHQAAAASSPTVPPPTPQVSYPHHHHYTGGARMHPRHQRIWHAHQHHQEMMRRHMGSSLNGGSGGSSSSAAAGQSSTVPPPLPAHMSHPFPYGPPMGAGHAAEFLGFPGHPLAFGGQIPGVHAHNHHHHLPHATLPTPMPFILPPVRYSEEYFRFIEQRRNLENNRGASKSCIERNTFPHKFKKMRGDGGEEDVDKCTICLCGKLF